MVSLLVDRTRGGELDFLQGLTDCYSTTTGNKAKKYTNKRKKNNRKSNGDLLFLVVGKLAYKKTKRVGGKWKCRRG